MSEHLLSSDDLAWAVDASLRSVRASTRYEAEELFLDDAFDRLTQLVCELPEEEFETHAVIRVLMSHGSGGPRPDSAGVWSPPPDRWLAKPRDASA